MNWIEVNDSMMLDLEKIVAITMDEMDENSTRIFYSASDSFSAPIHYETLKAMISRKRTLDKAAKESFEKSIKSLVKGQTTSIP